MTFDITKHITENNNSLDEARPAGKPSLAAAGHLEWVVDSLRNAEVHLHKARQSAREHVKDQSLDRSFTSVVGKLRAVRLEIDRLEAMEARTRV